MAGHTSTHISEVTVIHDDIIQIKTDVAGKNGDKFWVSTVSAVGYGNFKERAETCVFDYGPMGNSNVVAVYPDWESATKGHVKVCQDVAQWDSPDSMFKDSKE